MIIVLPIIVVAIVWLLSAPGARFLPRFVSLLDESTIYRSTFSFFTGRSSAVGRFKNRDIAVRLQLKRSRHGLGYLVIGMRAAESAVLAHDGIAACLREAPSREALATLVALDLSVALVDGWLTAEWQPHGFVIFPGRFSEERWRSALEALHTVAAALEDSAP